ncbi:hypothetical protein T06_7470 [Trichinella sp. T6]|nr:hypothetical protein T06_7470 [Trichinella sp. T6]
MHSIFVIIIVPFEKLEILSSSLYSVFFSHLSDLARNEIILLIHRHHHNLQLHEKKMNFNEQKALISLDKLNLFSIISNRAFVYSTDVQAEAIDYNDFVNFIFNRYSTLKMLRKIHA